MDVVSLATSKQCITSGFCVIIQIWLDICLPCQIYVCHVRYMSAMSDIYPTIPIYKLSFCLIIQIWLDICLPCQIYVSPLLNNSDLYVQRISGMSDIYRVCQPYIWYVRYISRLARIYLVCQIYIASGTHIYICQTYILPGRYISWHGRHVSCLSHIYRDSHAMRSITSVYLYITTSPITCTQLPIYILP
jgi:hypothetical protein